MPRAGPERRDASVDIGLPRIGQRLRGRRIGELLESEAADAHAEPAKFHVDVRPLRERTNRSLPAREHLVVLVGIDADRPAAVIEHDLRIRKRVARFVSSSIADGYIQASNE
jgi:hypothetical protein